MKALLWFNRNCPELFLSGVFATSVWALLSPKSPMHFAFVGFGLSFVSVLFLFWNVRDKLRSGTGVKIYSTMAVVIMVIAVISFFTYDTDGMNAHVSIKKFLITYYGSFLGIISGAVVFERMFK